MAFNRQNKQQGNTTTTTDAKRMRVYAPQERSSGKNFWPEIGSAWVNRDGSINVVLFATPVDGKMQIREDDYNAQQGQGGSHG